MLQVNRLDLDEFINRLKAPGRNNKVRITEGEITNLCSLAKDSLLRQETLLRLQSPLKICGDIHGQFSDLLKLFNIGGDPATTRYLFLGDFVDRGKNSVETICLILALKCRFPLTFFLIRGNHELAPINRVFGFFNEVERRFKNGNSLKLYLKFNEVFNHMPLAAVIDGNAFCCHGGLSPLLKSLNCIRAIQRPVLPRMTGLASDLLWSDPDDEDVTEWERQDDPDSNPKHRGIGYLWGIDAHEKFLKRNKLKLLIRAHECVDDGYRWMFGRQLVTIFSAPNYADRNYAAIGSYRNGQITFQQFR